MARMGTQQDSLFDLQGRNTLKLFFFAILAIALMTVDHKTRALNSIRATAQTIISPLYYVVDAPGRLSSWVASQWRSHATLVAENTSLKRAKLEQEAKLQQLASLQQENLRLRGLLDAKSRVTNKVAVAQLLSVSLDPFRHVLTLNRGASDALFVGQPFMDANGILGQITSVSRHTSTGMLISDPSHSLPVQINRTGVRALVRGLGESSALRMINLPRSADIEVGDLVVTSGLAQRFPVGLPVGTVQAVSIESGAPFAQALISPVGALDRAQEVLVIWPDVTSGETP